MIAVLDSCDCEFWTHVWSLSANSDYCYRPVHSTRSVRKIKREFALAEYRKLDQLAVNLDGTYIQFYNSSTHPTRNTFRFHDSEHTGITVQGDNFCLSLGT
jgi:hypothetical protein